MPSLQCCKDKRAAGLGLPEVLRPAGDTTSTSGRREETCPQPATLSFSGQPQLVLQGKRGGQGEGSSRAGRPGGPCQGKDLPCCPAVMARAKREVRPSGTVLVASNGGGSSEPAPPNTLPTALSSQSRLKRGSPSEKQKRRVYCPRDGAGGGGWTARGGGGGKCRLGPRHGSRQSGVGAALPSSAARPVSASGAGG